MRLGAGKNRIAGTPRKHQPRRNVRREEQAFQASLVKTLAMVLHPSVILFAVPNGGWRSPIEAKILVGQGVLPGIPDLMVLWSGADGIGRGAGMEIKASGGTTDENQDRMHARFEAAGVPVRVIRNLPDALQFLEGCGVPFRIKPPSQLERWR